MTPTYEGSGYVTGMTFP